MEKLKVIQLNILGKVKMEILQTLLLHNPTKQSRDLTVIEANKWYIAVNLVHLIPIYVPNTGIQCFS